MKGRMVHPWPLDDTEASRLDLSVSIRVGVQKDAVFCTLNAYPIIRNQRRATGNQFKRKARLP
jgi:hypothetical protein